MAEPAARSVPDPNQPPPRWDLGWWLPPVAVAALGLGLTLHGLGSRPLADFDEALDAMIIRHMAESGNWLVPVINGTAHLRRPPLYFWLSATLAVVSHQDSALVYRLPSALSGAALAASLVVVARRRFRLSRAAWLVGPALLTMPYFLLLSRAAMLNVLASALVAVAILAGGSWLRGRGGRGLALATGVALGLTVLDYSGAVALPLGVLLLDALWLRDRRRIRWGQLPLVVLPALALGLWWPLLMAVWFGHGLWSQYLFQNLISRVTGQVEQSPRPIYYYLPLLADGLGAWGPVLALALVAGWRRALRQPDSLERAGMLWLAVGLVGFSLAGTKLPWYVCPLYPACALLVVGYLGRWLDPVPDSPLRPSRAETVLLGAAAVAGIGLTAWPVIRPTLALGVCCLAGLAAIWVDNVAPGRRWEVPPRERLRGSGGSRLGMAAVGLVLLAATVRAAAFPTTIAAPGLAQELQPEPFPGPQAAIAKLAARDPAVPLGLASVPTPTLMYYSGRSTVAVYSDLEVASRARGSWLITETSNLPALRSRTPGLAVLGRDSNLVLVALPGSPRRSASGA